MKEIAEVTYIKNELSPSWFIEKPIDFEYKVYQLMAFLKKCGNNVNNGYWFPDFEIIEKRYKDIESFKESSEIIYANKHDKELFDYIYDLPNNSNEYAQVTRIVEFGYNVIGNMYYELRAHMEYIIANIKIFNKIKNKRKSPIYFIESCDTGIIEKYKVGKSSIINLGTFHSNNYSFLNNEENYIQIISNISIDAERCLIPIARNLIKSGDYF